MMSFFKRTSTYSSISGKKTSGKIIKVVASHREHVVGKNQT